MIYQFAIHERLPQGSAMQDCIMFRLYRKIKESGIKSLTREEKDYITNSLYGVTGNDTSIYRYMGFAADFSTVLNRYLVNERYYGWKEYYSADKTALRRCIGSHNIIEIVSLS